MLLRKRIFPMELCIKGSETLNPLTTLCRLCLIILLGLAVPVFPNQCPNRTPTELRQKSTECFQSYKTQKLNLDSSNQRLYSGVDVETLRAYCSSYITGMGCVGNLLNVCPEDTHDEIKMALADLDGLEMEISDLCRTNNLYEIYARVMNCFMIRGRKSEWCFNSKMNASLLNTLSSEEICSRMRDATSCIENNIRQECGYEAADLVHLLVKPMVKGSSSCVYTVYVDSTEGSTKTTDDSHRGDQVKDSHKQKPHGSSCHILPSMFLIFSNITIFLSTFLYSPWVS